MATKNKAKVTVEVNPEPKTATEKTAAESMAEIRAKMDEFANKYNEHVQFAEFKQQSEVKEKLEELRKEYKKHAKSEKLRVLAAQADPMVALIEDDTYTTYRAKYSKNDDGVEVCTIDTAGLRADPKELHDGIGKERLWWDKVKRVMVQHTAQSAKKFGLDPLKVKNTMAMNEEVRKAVLASKNDNVLPANLQAAVTAMVGDEYKVGEPDVEFVKQALNRYRTSMTIGYAKDETIRNILVDVCRHIMFGVEYKQEFKPKKNK